MLAATGPRKRAVNAGAAAGVAARSTGLTFPAEGASAARSAGLVLGVGRLGTVAAPIAAATTSLGSFTVPDTFPGVSPRLITWARRTGAKFSRVR